MFPTFARLSKASRAPLTPKRGNKDFYKGTRQAFLPGGRRTGAPGKHVIGGKAKYRLLDEQVRVFVAPPISILNSSDLKPYVALKTKLGESHETAVFSKFRRAGGLSAEHFLRVAREQTTFSKTPEVFTTLDEEIQPVWLKAKVKLGILDDHNATGITVRKGAEFTLGGASSSPSSSKPSIPKVEAPKQAPVRELEVVS